MYRDDAVNSSNGGIRYFTNSSTSVVTGEDSQNDYGLFKGILIRYWTEFYAVYKDTKIRSVVYNSADKLGDTAVNGQYGPVWTVPFTAVDNSANDHTARLHLSSQLSGAILFESAARIEFLDSK